MKKRVILLFMLLLASVLLLMGCDEEPNDTTDTTDTTEAETTSTEPYTLEFVSNGDKTCTVNLVINPAVNGPLDVVIPPTSPEGDMVTATGSTVNTWNYIFPMIMTAEFFEENILHPLEEAYGITLEEAEAIKDDASNPLMYHAFYLRKNISYFIDMSRDSFTSEEKWEEYLQEHLLGAHMNFYVLAKDMQMQELGRLNEEMATFTELTVEQALEEHKKFNAYLKQYEVDEKPYPTVAVSIRSVTLASGFSSLPKLGWGKRYEVILPDTLTSIDEYAFGAFTGLTSIVIPNSVTDIGQGAFSACENLKNVTISDGVASIGDMAFSHCTSLTSISVPDSVTSIGERVLRSCGSLTDITFQGTIAEWQAIEKGNDWNADTPAYTIHCTDGDIVKE